jgi:exonuclease III
MLLKCISVNMRGLCGNSKRAAFLIILKFYDVVLVQETHMMSDEIIKRAKEQWEGLSFWAKGELNRKGWRCYVDGIWILRYRRWKMGETGDF